MLNLSQHSLISLQSSLKNCTNSGLYLSVSEFETKLRNTVKAWIRCLISSLVVLMRVLGGRAGILGISLATYEMSAKSFDKTIVQPFEVRIPPGHSPLERESPYRVNRVAFFEQACLNYLGFRNLEVHKWRIYDNCFFHLWTLNYASQFATFLFPNCK